jgi:hypothetical protein
MTALAWLLLALCIIGPGVGLFVTRPRPTRCECGAFKLPRASLCFDCTIAERPTDPPNISAPAARKPR